MHGAWLEWHLIEQKDKASRHVGAHVLHSPHFFHAGSDSVTSAMVAETDWMGKLAEAQAQPSSKTSSNGLHDMAW